MRFKHMLLMSSVLLGCFSNVRADDADLTTATPKSVKADELSLTDSSPKFKLSGFGTLGYTHTGNDDLFFIRDISQPATTGTNNGFTADSRFGVQANATFGTDWEAVVQIVDRFKAQPSLGNSVEWAFLSYRPNDDTVIRVGRVGMDVFALSDFRNVGYAYTWVRPPTEFYGWIPIYSIDGADIATNIHIGDAMVRPKLFAGKSRLTIPSDGMNFDYDINNVFGFSVTAELNEWRARVSHVRATISTQSPLAGLITELQQLTPIWPQASTFAEELNIDGSVVNYTGLALSYDNGTWQVQSELSKVRASSTLEPGGYKGYISVGRRFNEWLPYVVYSKAIESGRDRAVAPPGFGLEPLAASINAIVDANQISQSTWAAGVRWDFNARMALKMQLSNTYIDSNGAGLWTVNSPTWSGGSRTQFSTTFDFIF